MMMPRESDLPMWSAVRDRGRAVRVRASDRVRTAAVLGLTRPVIAVPRDAAAALTAHEIDQVVLHEYAHVQRYDDWTKLLQVLIGAFAGWHPGRAPDDARDRLRTRSRVRRLRGRRHRRAARLRTLPHESDRDDARLLARPRRRPLRLVVGQSCDDAHRTAAGSAASVGPARGDARDGRQRHACGARVLHGSRTSDRHRSSSRHRISRDRAASRSRPRRPPAA